MHSLGWIEAAGWLAGALTLVTFAQTSMRAMRWTAIAANLCFLTYGLSGHIVPIVVLHGLLLPINVVRLHALYRVGDEAGACAPASAMSEPPALRDDQPRTDGPR